MDNHIGLRIRELCKEKNVSGAELARRLNIKPQAVQTLFNTKSPRVDTIEKVLGVLNVTIDEFYGKKVEQNDEMMLIKKSEYTSMLEQLVKYQQKELEVQKALVAKQEEANQTISTSQASNISK